MNHCETCNQQRRGFTLVELLVAVGITVVMLSLIGQIFTGAAAITSTGIATSKLIANSRTIGDQLLDDADAMLGPNSAVGARAGILVILQTNGVSAQYRDSAGAERTGFFASDQLAFFANNVGPRRETGLAPSAATTFAGSAAGDAKCVWYGHLLQEFLTTTPSTFPASVQLGTNDPSGRNQLISDWILGRQALLFVRSPAGTSYYAQYSSSATGPWAVANAGGLAHDMGVTDVLDRPLVDLAAGDGVIDQFSAATTPTDYLTEAYKYGYVGSPLRTSVDMSALTSLHVAQTHSIFMQHIADFVVEFAGDYRDASGNPGRDGQIDVVAPGSDDSILWYSFRDGIEPDSSTFAASPGAYKFTNPLPWNTNGLPEAKWYVFRHDDDQPYVDASNPGSLWPYLIRIRYRLLDPKGRIREPDGEPGHWFENIIKVNRPASN